MREWEENKQDTRPKVIRVSKNEREQVWPNTTQNDPDGIYAVGDGGTLQQYKRENSEPEEEHIE